MGEKYGSYFLGSCFHGFILYFSCFLEHFSGLLVFPPSFINILWPFKCFLAKLTRHYSFPSSWEDNLGDGTFSCPNQHYIFSCIYTYSRFLYIIKGRDVQDILLLKCSMYGPTALFWIRIEMEFNLGRKD